MNLKTAVYRQVLSRVAGSGELGDHKLAREDGSHFLTVVCGVSSSDIRALPETNIVNGNEAARMLGITRQRVNQLVKAGRLQQIEGRPHISLWRSEVEEFARQPKSRGGRPRRLNDLNRLQR